MKKSILLLVAGAITMSASAQYARHSSILLNPKANMQKTVGTPNYVQTGDVPAPVQHHSAARTTSITTCTYTETFPSTVFTTGGSGGAGDIWTVTPYTGSSPAGDVWKWSGSASGSDYSLGPIASTTTSDGWVIFDADSLRATGGSSTTYLPGGYLTSPAINCSALTTTVGLKFEELYEKGYQDTTYVQVATSSSGPWTNYPIYRNDNLFNQSTTPNPETIQLDITATAAGSSTVYIRFVFDDEMGYTFSWLIDDVCVGAIDAHDVGIDLSHVDQPWGGLTTGAFTSSLFNETPLQFISTTDSLYPVTLLTNYSHAAEPTVPVTVTLAGGSPAYSSTNTYTDLPGDAYDSGMVFAGYVPSAIGTYTMNFNAALAGDGNTADNTESVSFGIDDSVWNVNSGSVNLNSAYYIYGSAASVGSVISNCNGARFDVGSVTGDTVSGFGVGFASFSSATGSGKVSVQLYSNTQDGASWTYVGSSESKSLSASDFSTSSSVHWARFNTYTGHGPVDYDCILQPNTTYAAIVQLNNVTTDLLILSTPVPNSSYFDGGYFGQEGTSLDAGGQDFGATDQTGTPFVPLVQIYTGNIPTQIVHNAGVTNVNIDNEIGAAFPNPSNYSFTIPVKMAQDSKVTVTLTNVMGQVINTQNINAIGGQTVPVVFNTGNLAEGMYIYTISANGERTTGRVVVAH